MVVSTYLLSLLVQCTHIHQKDRYYLVPTYYLHNVMSQSLVLCALLEFAQSAEHPLTYFKAILMFARGNLTC